MATGRPEPTRPTVMITVIAPFTGPLAGQGYRLYQELLAAEHLLPEEARELVRWCWLDSHRP
ncbi:hypothetical protein [Streptomyces sp. NPDC096323]|uniref:hypothetical protein n=1 Tax=Streptomyces sp. NPDC096323 TaxID=3155822 RepID=UPI00331BF7EA